MHVTNTLLNNIVSYRVRIIYCTILRYVIFFLKIVEDGDEWDRLEGGNNALNVIKVTHRSICHILNI